MTSNPLRHEPWYRESALGEAFEQAKAEVSRDRGNSDAWTRLLREADRLSRLPEVAGMLLSGEVPSGRWNRDLFKELFQRLESSGLKDPSVLDALWILKPYRPMSKADLMATSDKVLPAIKVGDWFQGQEVIQKIPVKELIRGWSDGSFWKTPGHVVDLSDGTDWEPSDYVPGSGGDSSLFWWRSQWPQDWQSRYPTEADELETATIEVKEPQHIRDWLFTIAHDRYSRKARHVQADVSLDRVREEAFQDVRNSDVWNRYFNLAARVGQLTSEAKAIMQDVRLTKDSKYQKLWVGGERWLDRLTRDLGNHSPDELGALWVLWWLQPGEGSYPPITREELLRSPDEVLPTIEVLQEASVYTPGGPRNGAPEEISRQKYPLKEIVQKFKRARFWNSPRDGWWEDWSLGPSADYWYTDSYGTAGEYLSERAEQAHQAFEAENPFPEQEEWHDELQRHVTETRSLKLVVPPLELKKIIGWAGEE